MVDHYKIMDLIRKVNLDFATIQDAVSKPEPDRYEILNYAFIPGEKVKDKVTGKEVIVIAGERTVANV